LVFAIFGGCLACTTRRMRDMPLIGIYCDQLTEFVQLNIYWNCQDASESIPKI